MTIQDQKCDSCGKKVDILFPIRVLCETGKGYFEMQLKHYCPLCVQDTINGWVDADEKTSIVENWIIAWFKEGKIGYQILPSKEWAEEIYEKIKEGKDTEEVVLGTVTRRSIKEENNGDHK